MAMLVYQRVTPMSRTGLWYANNELVTGTYKATYNWGASHCRDVSNKLCRIQHSLGTINKGGLQQ